MSEKPKNLRSLALKCAGVLAAAPLSSTKPIPEGEPVGTAYNNQDELFEEGRPGHETDGQWTSAHVPT